MVKAKKNLLIISPTLPNPEISAGEYRVYNFTKELKKYFNIFFIPLNYKKLSKTDIKNFSQITKNIFKPTISQIKFKKFLKQYDISTCIIERYWGMNFKIQKLIPIIKNSIIDIHELSFKKINITKKIPHSVTTLYKAKELLFYKNAQILIVISEEEKKELKKLFPNKKIIVVPTCTKVLNSVNNDFDQRNGICYFGFMKYNDNNPNFDAVKYFIKNIFHKIQIPNLKFYILGYGSKQIKNTKNIISVDNIKNIPKELSKYKVFVCPLRYGAGLKKKVLDAMAAKTPIVSTNFGVEGIKNINKQYFDVDSKEFVNNIIKLYLNKTYWQKQSEKNFNIVNKYYSDLSFTKYVKRFVNLIK